RSLNSAGMTDRGVESRTLQASYADLVQSGTLIPGDLQELAPQSAGVLTQFAPFDPAAVEVAVQQVVDQLDNLGSQWAAWFTQNEISSYAFAAAAVVGFCEVK